MTSQTTAEVVSQARACGAEPKSVGEEEGWGAPCLQLAWPSLWGPAPLHLLAVIFHDDQGIRK
jgi:hypothetical protein